MVAITTISGGVIDVPDAGISLITGPYPHDVGPYTHVYGPAAGALVIQEAPQLLLSRLTTKADFGVLTRPNGSPAWVHAPSVSQVREPLWTELPDIGIVNAVVMIGLFHQVIRETVAIAIQIINAHNGRL